MEANQEFTAKTLERLQQASSAWYRSDRSPTPSATNTARSRSTATGNR
jgi:hypothetical protein